MSDRLDVRKTYKLFVKGAFPRSESGRSYEVTTPSGQFVANVAWASRKDLRDAVTAARGAQAGWWGATAYNRGQVLYRWAEMAEGRRGELAEAVVEACRPHGVPVTLKMRTGWCDTERNAVNLARTPGHRREAVGAA